MSILSEIKLGERHQFADAVRQVAWSPSGKLLALTADGMLFGLKDHPVGPVASDPVDVCWLSRDQVVVVDGVVGAAVIGMDSFDCLPVPGPISAQSTEAQTDEVESDDGYCVLAGAGGLSVLRRGELHAIENSTIPTGAVRAAVHLGGPAWLGAGVNGLVVVDVDRLCVSDRLEIPSVVSIAAAAGARRIAAADSTGSIHVRHLSDLKGGFELTGYPDAIRHLGMSPVGDFVVAGSDDELSWWHIDDEGVISGAPECSIGHDTPITCCDVGATGFVATGDADGLVRLWSPDLRDIPVCSMHLDSEVTVLRWSVDGERLAMGTTTGGLVIADVVSGELV